METKTPKDVFTTKLDDSIVIVDVRTAQEFEEGHVEGAVNIPLEELATRMDALTAYEAVYAICRSGARSAIAATYLSEEGFNAHNIEGGMLAWEQAGFPVVS